MIGVLLTGAMIGVLLFWAQSAFLLMQEKRLLASHFGVKLASLKVTANCCPCYLTLVVLFKLNYSALTQCCRSLATK